LNIFMRAAGARAPPAMAPAGHSTTYRDVQDDRALSRARTREICGAKSLSTSPKTWTKPWTVVVEMGRAPDARYEFIDGPILREALAIMASNNGSDKP